MDATHVTDRMLKTEFFFGKMNQVHIREDSDVTDTLAPPENSPSSHRCRCSASDVDSGQRWGGNSRKEGKAAWAGSEQEGEEEEEGRGRETEQSCGEFVKRDAGRVD